MKTSILAIALTAAGLVAIPAVGHAQDKGGFFINGQVGQATLDKGVYDDDDTAYGVNLGYRWALNPAVALGVEGGYTDLGTFDPKSSARPVGRADLKGWTLGVNGHFNINDNWYLSGRGGLFRADMKGGYRGIEAPVYVDDTSNGWYTGVGFGYDFSNKASVGLNYDYYKVDEKGLKLDPGVISVGAEVRF